MQINGLVHACRVPGTVQTGCNRMTTICLFISHRNRKRVQAQNLHFGADAWSAVIAAILTYSKSLSSSIRMLCNHAG